MKERHEEAADLMRQSMESIFSGNESDNSGDLSDINDMLENL